jgi:hypothetical protein
MARKTKAEMALEAENARYMQEAEAEATYLPRLMAALAQATNDNFELTVEDNLFVVRDRDSNTRDTFAMSPTYTREAWELDSLESYLAEKEAARVESERKYLVRLSALNKLTAEEKQLLNL